MKRKDLVWILILIVISFFIFLPYTNPIFINITTEFPYMMGFIKTMILASMGEMLVRRIKTGSYFGDPGLFMKAVVWGFLGMVFVFVFPLFDGGIRSIFSNRVLFENSFLNTFIYALLVSMSMNILFAPTFMMFHRVTDAYINLSKGKLKEIIKLPLNDVIESIDFKFFFSFVVIKTIPLFWIPAHTITFMLPPVYRVLMASYLSIALGVLLTLKRK